MSLDLKTMSLMVVITAFLYAIPIAFFAFQANQYKGITLYMWGAICSAMGFLFVTFQTMFPEFFLLRLGVSGFFMLTGYFYCLGIVRFLDFNFKLRWLNYLLLSGFVAIFYFIVVNKLGSTGNLLIPVYMIIFYSITCYFLWQRRWENFSSSIYFMLFNIVFIILIFAARCYAVVIYNVQSSFQNQAINNAFLLAVFISSYLRNVGFIMMVSHRLYQDLRETALQDFLTKIYNRRAIQQVLDQQFNQFQRYQGFCSLILLDIDYFKKINDNYGHETGDKVLQAVTAILKSSLRKTDTLGRWGGEEFLVVLPNTNIEKALETAEKLRSEIAKDKIVDIICTVSLGVKMLDINDSTIDEAIKCADDALYKAKHNGRNCVVVFDKDWQSYT